MINNLQMGLDSGYNRPNYMQQYTCEIVIFYIQYQYTNRIRQYDFKLFNYHLMCYRIVLHAAIS